VGGLSADELRAAVAMHIREVAGHFRGRVHAWDVVNEAVADDETGLRDTVFRQRLGDGYIAEAFRLAREADPGALLFYNDYNGEGAGAKSDRIYDLVRRLPRASRSTASAADARLGEQPAERREHRCEYATARQPGPDRAHQRWMKVNNVPARPSKS
jgi:hypothetical protein